MYIDSNGHITLWSHILTGQKSLILRWCSFTKWGREHLAFFFAYKGSQYVDYVLQQLNYISITWRTRPIILDALLTLIFRNGQGVCLFPFWLSKYRIHRQKTMTELTQYFSIHSRMLECTHKWNNQKSTTRNWNWQVTRNSSKPMGWRYGYEFAPPSGWGLCFWIVLGPNKTVCAIRFRTADRLPRLIANTSHSWTAETPSSIVQHTACDIWGEFVRKRGSGLWSVPRA